MNRTQLIILLCIFLFHVSYQGDIEIKAEEEQYLVYSTDSFIKCQVTSTLSTIVTWFHNHTTINLEGDKYIQKEDGLLVKGVTTDDEGDYQCRAEVPLMGILNEAMIEVRVVMDTTPKISGEGEVLGILEENVFVNCLSVTGDGNSLKWLDTEGQVINDTSERISTKAEGAYQRLDIKGLRDQDFGVYTCEHAGLQDSVQISLYQPISTEAEPVQHLVVSTEGLIKCRVTGYPAPTVYWRINGTSIRRYSAKYSIEEEGLKVQDVTLADQGEYQCRAELEKHGRLDVARIDVIITQN